MKESKERIFINRERVIEREPINERVLERESLLKSEKTLSLSVPDFGSLTMNEIIENADKLIVKNKNITFQKKENGNIISLSITNVNEGKTTLLSNFEEKNLKSNYKDDVKILLEKHYTQEEIAIMLDISQSYVSKLARMK